MDDEKTQVYQWLIVCVMFALRAGLTELNCLSAVTDANNIINYVINTKHKTDGSPCDCNPKIETFG